MENSFNAVAAAICLKEAVGLIAEGKIEDVLRQRFAAHLPRMFPNDPWWVAYHGLGSEHHVKFDKDGKAAGGFVDSLVGLTAIEYEKDISQPAIFRHGLNQVRDYCAGLLNKGHAPDLIVGVLSDTVRWRAYRISSVLPLDPTASGIFGRVHVELEEIDSLDASAADESAAARLGEFLVRHLGREGARPLGAETLSRDLGFESQFCERYVAEIWNLVGSAFASNPKYSGLIKKLWLDFVAYLGDSATAGEFDKDVYVRELYLLTLAKLLCANVISKSALTSDEYEIRAILNGDHFKMKGLANLVEYDYFGWLSEDPHVSGLIPVAKAIQDDLRAYDFVSPPAEDLFGATMAQLAKRSQRLLLGQEWTPSWLSAEVVKRTMEALPEGEAPRLVDMCCGSGAMVVEAVKQSKLRLDAAGAAVDAAYVTCLAHAITGFDIDPLAVMLSKVGWVVSARDRLEPFGTFQVSIPIYHADSLFAATPLSKSVDEDTGSASYDLVLDDLHVALPSYLVSPEHRALFDALLSGCYSVAMESATGAFPAFSASDLSDLLKASEANAGTALNTEQRESALAFCGQLVGALDTLQRDGRNGIWSFVLRNSYRPALVSGLFNGLVSNPPWLALSKIADNPYREALRKRAENYEIKPAGPSHLHIELATIFLLHAIERYLLPGSTVGCILPETLLSGHHHNPFRTGAFLSGRRRVPLAVDELWRIEKGTFKNEAIVLFGTKESRGHLVPAATPGHLVSKTGKQAISFRQIAQGTRVAWTDRGSIGTGGVGFFSPAEFRQGADIMPRTLIFHEVSTAMAGKWSLGPIDRGTSRLRYLVAGAKKHEDFSLPACLVPDQFVFDVLMSNHLTPFDIATPAKGFLPIEKDHSGKWSPVAATKLATQTAAKIAFDRIFSVAETNANGFFEMLDSKRRKLTAQDVPTTGWLIFMGAGGDYVCAAYADASFYGAEKLVVDQTLYWTSVESEDEALYLVGLLNSDAVNEIIKEFQPRGQFGARHVHTLPIGVTPEYNPSDAAHADVVAKTRILLDQWEVAKVADAEITGLLDPNKSLAQRRRRLRLKVQALPGYLEYALACRNLYGV